MRNLLGDMNPFVFTDLSPADPAIWAEWVACAKDVQFGGVLTANSAFQTLNAFLHANERQYGYEAAEILASIQTASYQKRWSQLLEKASSIQGDGRG